MMELFLTPTSDSFMLLNKMHSDRWLRTKQNRKLDDHLSSTLAVYFSLIGYGMWDTSTLMSLTVSKEPK